MEDNRIQNQIAIYMTNKKLCEFTDKLKPAPIEYYAHMHAQGEEQAVARVVDLETAVAQINAEMERVIRARPEQYLWGYGRYKQPRRETPPGPPDEPKAQPSDKV